MRLRKLIIAALASVAMQPVFAGNISKVYMYGFGASFNDSTVYFTDIQEVDSAWVGKQGFLYSRDNYSYQLRDYLEKLHMEHATCVTTWSKDRKDLEKKLLYMKKKYSFTNTKKKSKFHYLIKDLSINEFQFKGIYPDDETAKKIEKNATEAKKNNKKRERMAPKGERPNHRKGGMMGGQGNGPMN
ncbi:hypothetical protein prwr041_24610 [Prevotella herbatica]|uniref:Uncharacterized protein n=1 Tax=Prevotella herbatica TaxID=2801997 RepID=A0ABM7P1C7_9BACT|nr:hypothetical protein [Prevotella herbatica]BCS86568.1 hypothetical protein prwr041_24610 [Prevotella herbatica]